ncbi:MAG: NUDIX hydrolase [Magnetococcales bacterium]|nr:NUDIX hydrolase [Magnetococcales bacterium]
MTTSTEPDFIPASRFKVTVSAHVLIVDRPVQAKDRVRILLAKLAYRDHRAGKWSFPGGFVDQGEGLESALKREVSEEIGLELLQCRYLETVPLLLVESPNIGFIFLCDAWNGTPQVKSREILETVWVDEETFWRLDREGQLAYPQMRTQTGCLGWQPQPEEIPVAAPGSSRCLWGKALLTLFLTLATVPVLAGDPEEKGQEEALEQAKDHVMDAMRSLGKAGRLTYENQLPALKEKTEEAIQETQRLIEKLEERLPRLQEKKNEPAPPRGMTQI